MNYTPLNWVGGKGKLVESILALVDIQHPRFVYAEPFFGSGEMFYRLPQSPARAYVADTCAPLLNFHEALWEDQDLLRHEFEMLCQDHPPFVLGADGRLTYYSVRDRLNARKHVPLPGVDYRLAALFLYINRFGFNGLYRENREGGCNVPAGSAGKAEAGYRKVRDYLLRRLSEPFRVDRPQVYADYRMPLSMVRHETLPVLVYCDPPYLGTWTGYGGEWDDPEATMSLVKTLEHLSLPAGSVIALSNSVDAETCLDKAKWSAVHYLSRSGAINSDATKRGKVKEILAIRRV